MTANPTGVFAVFRSFILREGPFAGAGTVKSIGQLGGEENDESLLGRTTGETDGN